MIWSNIIVEKNSLKPTNHFVAMFTSNKQSRETKIVVRVYDLIKYNCAKKIRWNLRIISLPCLDRINKVEKKKGLFVFMMWSK